MRKHRGLTRGKSILFHGLQQLSAFLACTCIAMLVFYSFIFVRTNNANYSMRHILYDWNIFSEEASFEETSTFDTMLMDSLQEIIRYNVAKSQLEVDGKFDGSKVIDVRAFVNRKDNLQSGLDIVPGFEDSSKEDIRNYEPTAEYYLEDLLKWERYGVTYEMVTMSEYDFVTYFGADYLQWYDVNPTEEQIEVLNNTFGEKVTQLLIDKAFEIYGYEGMYTFDAERDSAAQIEAYEKVTENQAVLVAGETEQAESYEVYELAVYPTTVHLAFADLLLSGVPVNYTYVDDKTGEIMVEVLVLNERYQTADEQTLFAKVDSWEKYFTLVQQVRQAVSDLAYNYNEYLDFAEKYGTGATNIVYTFEMTMMGEQVLVSNLYGAEDASFDALKLSAEELDEHFRTAYGRYMIYRPQTMTFESNTGIIEENDLFEAFSSYEYAYPETAEIWLAVDTTYPVSDRFSEAAAAYNFIQPYAYIVAVIGGICILDWLILFLFLSVMTGYRRGREETEAVLTLSWVDSIPTEIAAVLGGGIGCGSLLAVVYAVNIIKNGFSGAGLDYVCTHRMQVALLTGLLSMLFSAFFCICWYSLMRRIKAHMLWKKSLIYLLYRCTVGRLIRAVKRVAIKLYDNSSIAMRGILVLGGIVLFNFIMGAVFYRYRHVFIFYGGMGFVLFILFILFILGVNGVALFFRVCSHEKRKKIIEGIGRIRDGEVTYQVDITGLHGENLQLAEAVNSIGEGIKNAVETSMKDERLKADLITNVSHDIKTPLTSIINYVDLLKREKLETEPVKGYIEILDAKSQRLKQLTDDLVEASKISSGNITLIMEKINLTELIHQSLGEFSEKFEEKSLSIMESIGSEAVYIKADSRRIWRVIENLFGNIYKYALEGTRVYLDMLHTEEGRYVSLSLKNISAQSLNIRADELTERFIRGDVSRSTEGSGLGLSIAKNLTELQDGKFNIYLDGDLFKVTLTFPVYEEI